MTKRLREALPDDAPEIATMRRADPDALRRELVALADAHGLDRQNATRLAGTFWKLQCFEQGERVHTLGDLYNPPRPFQPMRNGSKGWKLLAAWLRSKGHHVPPSADPAPRCQACGHVLQRRPPKPRDDG